jgi:hypothetical protein
MYDIKSRKYVKVEVSSTGKEALRVTSRTPFLMDNHHSRCAHLPQVLKSRKKLRGLSIHSL